MAGSNNVERKRVLLPRNWRLCTIASATVIGMACGAVEPASGEWWKLSKSKPEPKAPAATSPVGENGFVPTIRRLMADANKYAEKGELDKAVQLAERAAKISEASAQLIGPSSECSPEVTAQFAAYLRSRRDAVAKTSPPDFNQQNIAATSKVQPAKETKLEQPVVAKRPQSQARPVQPSEPKASEAQVADLQPEAKQPVTKPSEARIEQKAIIESPVVEKVENQRDVAQATKKMSRDEELAWAQELPPTPSPEPEPKSKPVKFRRGVLARAGHSVDESFDDDWASPDESVASSSANAVLAEAIEADIAIEAAMEVEPMASEKLNATSESTVAIQPELTKDELPSLNGEIQSVASESSANEITATKPDSDTEEDIEWAKPESPSEEQKLDAPLIPEEQLPVATSEQKTKVDDEFPVQRVVQLRRRLETVSAFKPGEAFAQPPAKSEATPIRQGSASAATESEEFEQTSKPLADVTTADVDESASDAPKRPQTLRLREHRFPAEQVSHAASQQFVVPPPPPASKHVVGHSEPILWRTAPQTTTTSTPTPATDLRNEAAVVGRAESISAAPVEQVAYESRADKGASTSAKLLNGPALAMPVCEVLNSPANPSSSHGGVDQSLDGADHQPDAPWVVQQESETLPHRKIRHAASHEDVSRRSFAAIEQLAGALKLPVATTASLLGGAGLALLGLGLLLVRAAIRWKHS